MKRLISTTLGLLVASVSFGQDQIAIKYAETILATDLKQDLMIVASDSFAGRETGTAGQRMAATYIANHFKRAGLNPQQQEFKLEKSQTDTSYVIADGKRFEFMEDFYFFRAPDYTMNFKEMLFLGYGIDDSLYSDYKDTEVAGKAIVIMNGEPLRRDERYLISGSFESSNWSTKLDAKLKVAEAKGVKAVFVIDPEAKKNMKNYGFFLTRARTGLKKETSSGDYVPQIYVTEKMATALLGGEVKKFEKIAKKIGKKKKPRNQLVTELNIDVSLSNKKEELSSTNVMAYLEGTDKKDELLVITAHYDHIGKDGDKIFNGADDDGSGTVTVLELADAFAAAKRDGNGPRRSILFMCVSGEEKGLLGSEYYTDNPVYPLSKTVCNLNIDMVGRVDKEHKKNPNYVYLIGSDKLSTELHSISDSANKTYTNLELDYTYNAPDDPNRFYYRSDHYNFAKNNIPIIFYFNGVHEDYHKETDTVEKINFEKMQVIGRLVFHTAWEVANREERLVVDVKNDFGPK